MKTHTWVDEKNIHHTETKSTSLADHIFNYLFLILAFSVPLSIIYCVYSLDKDKPKIEQIEKK